MTAIEVSIRNVRTAVAALERAEAALDEERYEAACNHISNARSGLNMLVDFLQTQKQKESTQ